MFKFFNRVLDDVSRDKALIEHDGKDYKKFINNTGFNVFMVFAIVFCLLALFFISSMKKPTEFYLVNTEKKEMQDLKTLPKPIISAKAVESWNSNALINIFTFDFTNHKSHFDKTKIFFTVGGYKGFMNSLEKSGLIESVSNSSLEVTLTPVSKSIIISNPKTMDGTKSWNVEMEAFISYMGTGEPKNDKVYVVTDLVEVPTYENPNGIAIKRLMLIKK